MINWKRINCLLKLCIDIAEWHDQKGEEDPNWFGGEMANAIMGYRALTAYMRVGVKEVIDLQAEYHREREKRHFAESHEKEMQEFVQEVFGEEEPEAFNEEIKSKIRKAVKEIVDEWEKESC